MPRDVSITPPAAVPMALATRYPACDQIGFWLSSDDQIAAASKHGWSTQTISRESFRLLDSLIAPELPAVRYVATQDYNNDCFTEASATSQLAEGQFPWKIGSGLGQRLDVCIGGTYPARNLVLSQLDIIDNGELWSVLSLAQVAQQQFPADLEGVTIGYPLLANNGLDGAGVSWGTRQAFEAAWPKATVVPFPGETAGLDCFTAVITGEVSGCAVLWDSRRSPTLLDAFLAGNAACRAGENPESCLPAEQEGLLAELNVNPARDYDDGLFAVDDSALAIIKDAWVRAMENGRYRQWCSEHVRDIYCPSCGTAELRASCLHRCVAMTGKPCA
eukprot:TRINITY_DN52573_c0_g1_i1.p1 TRINITY_DN52573_c0_g1~~TRINITY_DN52573_c0_g1_i1.p1  ORF type:complete len:332 (+),score=12.13 TRINITY_DN52573_c0_g1_i1:75-1070(+)